MQEMQEMRVQFLDHEDFLEKEMATHSSTSCLGNPMNREAWWGYGPWGHKESDVTQATEFRRLLTCGS